MTIKLNTAFYVNQSMITDPQHFISMYDRLPDSPQELLKVVQGLVIHAEHGKLYKVSFSKKQMDEELLRTVPQILESICALSNDPLITPRIPKERLVGMCRDYALLFISFLRYKGIPARLRVGYANYFDSDLTYEDHWLVEFFDEEKDRWIRVDAQVDAVQRIHFGLEFDTWDMTPSVNFLLSGEVWSKARIGECHHEDFGYNKQWKGWKSIKGNLIHDYNCLQSLELLPWDLWSDLSAKKFNELNKNELSLIDEMAELTSQSLVTTETLECFRQKLPDDFFESIHSQLVLLGLQTYRNMVNPDELEKKHVISEYKVKNDEEVQVGQIKAFETIQLIGGRQNNLKNINIEIPHNKLIVITGVSGSGKSSLAFDTIYAEGKRRYLDYLSNAAKLQDQVEKPEFDTLQGLTPTIAIEQKKGSQNPRSTVGTMTGILDYMRMLFVAIGKPHCPYCGTQLKSGKKNKKRCDHCGLIFSELTASSFNPNSHIGACSDCNGLGIKYEINREAIVKEETISILDGATYWWGKLRGKKVTGNWMTGELYAIAKAMDIDLNTPWNKLPDDFKKVILEGDGDKIYHFTYNSRGREAVISRLASGAYKHILRLFRESKIAQNSYRQFMTEVPCKACNGELLCHEARYTAICGWRFPELIRLPLDKLYNWTHELNSQLSKQDYGKVSHLIPDIELRIENLIQVGLPYLTLNRKAPTLSGGELQRVRLSSQLGSDLMGLTYVLDEPSIGLHPTDNHLMVETLKKLRDKGNTVIVVEHDKDTMLAADYIVDIGPGAGIYGGEVIAHGDVNAIINNKESITGSFLVDFEKKPLPELEEPTKWLTIKGCIGNNLKNVTAQIPLGKMCCIAGKSGSGKSTLIFDTLIPALEEQLNNKRINKSLFQTIEGIEGIDGIVQMDQTPIGKSNRSTPVTYVGAFNDIRSTFASLEDVLEDGLSDKHFSFNSKSGQCPTCEGLGEIKVAFQYMADYYVTCPECHGKRYKKNILDMTYQGCNISDVLNMDVSEGIKFWNNHPQISQKLQKLSDVGLAYLKLGQSTTTLSGGEAQRLKLAKELTRKQKKHIVYILDEPTTGLHFNDIQKLIVIFKKLVAENHTVLIIEHNTDLISESDWIIDMGPEGGVNGGYIVATGTPKQLRQDKNSVTGQFI